MPLLLGVLTGAGAGAEVVFDPELLDEDEDPPELEEPAAPDVFAAPAVTNAVVVVPGDLVKAFDPPHPVMKKIAVVSAAIVPKPCRFSRILTFQPGGLPAFKSK